MKLTTNGIIFITLAWTIIISLVSYSYYKVFKGDKKK
jgi:hypothetical protein